MPSGTFGKGLIGHWPMAGDFEDYSGTGLVVRNHGVELADGRGNVPKGAARFNGTGAHLEVEDHPAMRLGAGDFSVSTWVRTAEGSSDVVGDLVSKFDTDARKGLNLSIVTNGGMTYTAQSNYRNLHFGIDDGRVEPSWTDCGRPGNAAMVAALKVYGGALYAGTLELGAEEAGHVWRLTPDRSGWSDLGSPDGANIVNTVAEFEGRLFCGTGRYWPHGSAMGDALNQTPGGKVYRLEADGSWSYRGHPGAEDAVPEKSPAKPPDSGKADDVLGLTVFNGDLYCTSNHRRGVFKYRGGERWEHIGLDERVLSLAIYRDRLYALTNKGGPVYRYEGGNEWVHRGRPGTSTETYAAVVHCGQLYVGTWPEAEVFRSEGEDEWARIGAGPVGYEREIMGMALYNGKVYVGTLPMGHVWRMDGEGFAYLGTLDNSPAPMRRVWTMAVFDGRLYAGTLPSGRVYSIEAGKAATWDRVFPEGWHHVAAVKDKGGLRVYVDGELVAVSRGSAPKGYDLSNDRNLLIGFGTHDYFRGSMSDMRLYGRALGEGEIEALATMAPGR